MSHSPREIIKYSFWGSFGVAIVLLVGFLFVRLIDIWLLLFLSIILMLFLSFFVDFFRHRLGIPRGIGLVITVLILGALVTGFFLTLVPVVMEQGRMAIQQLPNLISSLQATVNQLLDQFDQNANLKNQYFTSKIKSQVDALIYRGFSIVRMGVSTIIAFTVLVIVAFYFVVKPMDLNTFARWFPEEKRRRVKYLIHTLIGKIRSWLMGQLFAMGTIAVFYIVGLTIIGVPYAIFFGLLAGLVCFVPYIGPPVSTLGPILFALGSNPVTALWVVLLYIISQVVESYFLTPMVMKYQVKLHPVTTIISILVMGELFGILGVVVSVPLVASSHFLIEELYLKNVSRPAEEAGGE